MRAEVVFFDIGETLVSGPPEGPAKRIARRLGLTAAQRSELHRALMTRPFESPGGVADWLRDAIHVDGRAAVEEVWAAQEHEAEPLPGAAEAIAELREDGVAVGLLSNIWRPYLTSAERHFGGLWDEHVPERLRFFSFRAGTAKPERAIFEQALHAAGIPAERAMMIGDHLHNDIEPARALGMQTRWVTGGVAARA